MTYLNLTAEIVFRGAELTQSFNADLDCKTLLQVACWHRQVKSCTFQIVSCTYNNK